MTHQCSKPFQKVKFTTLKPCLTVLKILIRELRSYETTNQEAVVGLHATQLYCLCVPQRISRFVCLSVCLFDPISLSFCSLDALSSMSLCQKYLVDVIILCPRSASSNSPLLSLDRLDLLVPRRRTLLLNLDPLPHLVPLFGMHFLLLFALFFFQAVFCLHLPL